MSRTPATLVSSRPGSFHPLPASLNSIGLAFFTRSFRSCNQERFTCPLQSVASALFSKMPGVWGSSPQTLLPTTSKPLTSVFSSSCTLFCPMAIPQLSYFQRFARSFCRDGGCRGVRPKNSLAPCRCHSRHRDEKPVTITPSESVFTNCDARNPFRDLCTFARLLREESAFTKTPRWRTHSYPESQETH